MMGARGERKPRAQHDPAYQVLCAMLKELRESEGLTQRELAGRLRRQRSYVWKVEASERRLDTVELVRWCWACGREPESLFKELVKVIPKPRG